MDKIYASFIIFFYFIKYPICILLPILYFYIDMENNWILNILWIVSIILILKDWFFPIKKDCKPK